MKGTKKRILALVLCVLLIGAVLPVSAAAADDYAELTTGLAPAPEDGVFDSGAVSNEAAGITTYNPTDATNQLRTAKVGQSGYISAYNNSWGVLSGTVTSCSSSNASIISVKVSNGKCLATLKKAGVATVTIRSANWVSIYKYQVQFKDVTSSSAYYYDPVYWALQNEITTGKTNESFCPGATCTRGQIVTFLWRAAGEPNVTYSNPFTDVKPGDYCYKAVLWAYYKGITSGKTSTRFVPNETCNRAQAMTFLWRYFGSPDWANAPNPFYDVYSDEFYYQAVLWGYYNNITDGTSSTTFSPYKKCTRAQIVTFIYRVFAG